ncbi:VRR-NUC domain-containing protein [Ornithobacterium rhinotracheale]
MKKLESNLQSTCVRWFRYAYPRLRLSLFAVPNGGSRNVREASRLKKEGVVAGVADLILLTPNDEFGALCIEMKVGKNKQTENQILFQKEAERNGNKYIVVRSFDEFQDVINDYLKNCSY